MNKKGEIVKYVYSDFNNDTVWGRKEWLDEKGEPKKEYFTNPKPMNNNTMQNKLPLSEDSSNLLNLVK